MPDRRGRVDGARGALVVEGDVAAGDRRAERATGVGDAAAGLAELEEHLRLLRVAEVEAVGDAEGPAPVQATLRAASATAALPPS